MKIGIFGGTFNPPHIGHVQTSLSVAGKLGLDRMIVVPAGNPPHKTVPDGAPNAQERLKLTKLAFAGAPNTEVSDFEVLREGPNYTMDTLTHFSGLYPDSELVLITGTDMFLSLPSWKKGVDILSSFSIAVMCRDAGQREMLEQTAQAYRVKFGTKVSIPETAITKAASTEIRSLLPQRKGCELLPDSVYSEIIRLRLYGARPDFEWLRGKAYAMLKPKRIPHVKGCEEEAVRLAQRWGENPEEAAEAGILHDITKKLDLRQQLLLCEKYDILIDALEKQSDKLLHSKTGAALAKYEFGVSDNVYTAITWHTTGRGNMSTMEKILYLADYMEPNRCFEGVDELRRLSYTDLDRAMELGLRMSVNDLTSRSAVIHKKTAEALRFYSKGKDTETC